MKKIISSILITGLISSSLLAAPADEKKENKSSIENKKDSKKRNMHQGNDFFALVHKLKLDEKQKKEVKEIMDEARKNEKNSFDAFSKTEFDKNKFIDIEKDKRDSMIESKADTIEKIYKILTAKQKEQLKVLIDSKKDKMEKK